MDLISGIAAVVVPVFLVSLAGFIWAKRGMIFDQTMVTQLVVQLATPCLVFSTLTKMQVPLDGLGRMGAATVVCHLAFALVGILLLRAKGLSPAVYLPSLIFPNVGNLGLPVCLFAFGQNGMALAMIYMALSLVGQFTMGPAISQGKFDIKRLATLPFIHAVIIAVAINLWGVKVPAWIDNTLTLMGALCVPLMLMSLGVALGQLRVQSFGRAFLLSALRVVGGGLIGWGIATAFGLDGAYRGVLVIQSFMPTAVFNYLFARINDQEPGEVASLILVTTGLAYLLLPVVVGLVM